MIEVTFFFPLVIYLAIVLITLIYVFFNLYHLVRFGVLDFYTVFFSFFFLAVLIFILFVSYGEIMKIDWHLILFSIKIPEIDWPVIN